VIGVGNEFWDVGASDRRESRGPRRESHLMLQSLQIGCKSTQSDEIIW
jgi:hypothetical protein